MHKNICLKDKR